MIAPGYIDLSDLRFSATDAEYQDYEDDDDTFEDDGNGGGRRTQSRKLSSTGDDDTSNAGLETGTALDIAVFHLVSETYDDPPWTDILTLPYANLLFFADSQTI